MKILRTQQAASEPSLKDALPLGTVLSVREQPEQKYMIIGYATNNSPFAYYAVPWPQGFIGEESLFLVERYEITAINGRGIYNTESALFLQALDTVLKGEATNDGQRTEANA